MKKLFRSAFFTKRISPPEIFLLVVLGIFGALAIWWLPMGAGYDEETHLVRVWEMSAFDMLPNNLDEPQMPFPAIYWEHSYRRDVLVEPVAQTFWQEYRAVPIDGLDYIYGVTTRSVYSPPMLLPQALVVRYAGRSFGWAALPVFYLARLAGLLAYLALVWVAVRMMPYAKWLFALLAVSPVAILQAATISADSISNGIALLFIAGVLAIAQQDEIDWLKWWGLLLLAFLLFWAKVNLLFLILLPFLLISPSRFKKKKMLLLMVGALGILFLVEVVGWNVLAYPRLGTPPEGTDPVGQVRFILSHLPTALSVLFGHAFRYAGERFLDWMAIYGYNYWPVPQITYWLYGIALTIAVFIKSDDESLPSRKERWILGALFVIGYMATIGLMYLSFTPVSADDVLGVQGRYYFVVMPLLFLAVFALKTFKPEHSRRAIWSALLLGTLSLVSYSVGGWLSYHVPCGSQYYRNDLCYQPRYKNFSPDASFSAPLTTDLTLGQEIVPKCDGMTEIRVRVNTEDGVPNGLIRFTFSSLGGDAILEKDVRMDELPISDWYDFSFPPIWDSSQHAYLLTITSTSPESGLRIAYSLRPEYLDGKLFENGVPSQQDMIFQYGCVAGWDKLWR